MPREQGHTTVFSCISTANCLRVRVAFWSHVWFSSVHGFGACSKCRDWPPARPVWLCYPQPFLCKQTVVFIRLLLEKGNTIIGLCLGCIEPFFSFCSISTTVYFNWSFNKSPSNLPSRCSLRLGTVWDHHSFHRQFCSFFMFSLLCCFTLFSTGAQERNNCVFSFSFTLFVEGLYPLLIIPALLWSVPPQTIVVRVVQCAFLTAASRIACCSLFSLSCYSFRP